MMGSDRIIVQVAHGHFDCRVFAIDDELRIRVA